MCTNSLIKLPERKDVKKEASLIADFYDIDEDLLLSERNVIMELIKYEYSNGNYSSALQALKRIHENESGNQGFEWQ